MGRRDGSLCKYSNYSNLLLLYCSNCDQSVFNYIFGNFLVKDLMTPPLGVKNFPVEFS